MRSTPFDTTEIPRPDDFDSKKYERAKSPDRNFGDIPAPIPTECNLTFIKVQFCPISAILFVQVESHQSMD